MLKRYGKSEFPEAVSLRLIFLPFFVLQSKENVWGPLFYIFFYFAR